MTIFRRLVQYSSYTGCDATVISSVPAPLHNISFGKTYGMYLHIGVVVSVLKGQECGTISTLLEVKGNVGKAEEATPFF